MDGSSLRIRLLSAAFALAMCGGVATGGEPVAELDEFAVTGKSLRKLQREAIAAEDRFYRRFNTLNTRDDFDIHCDQDKATGTLVPKRRCRIQFLIEAGSIDAQDFHRALMRIERSVHTPIPVQWLQWEQRREEFQQAVRALVEKDAELKAMAEEWGSLLLQVEQVRGGRAED